MSTTLNKIFDDILTAERRAHSRKQYLASVKEEIKKSQMKEKELQGEQVLMNGQIAMKIEQLSQKQTCLNWIENRKSILNNKKAQLEQQKEECKECLLSLEEDISLLRETFCAEAKLFCENSKFNENRADAVLSSKQKEMLENLEEEKKCLVTSLHDYESKMSELAAGVEIEKRKLNDLELEKERVAVWPPVRKNSKSNRLE